MRKTVYSLVSLFIASQFLISCSSESDLLSQFSKRKYMKRFKSKNIKHENKVDNRDNIVEYKAIPPNDNVMIASGSEVNKGLIVETKETKDKEIKSVYNSPNKINDNEVWNNYNRNWNLNKLPNYDIKLNQVNEKKNMTSIKNNFSNTHVVGALIVGLFCFFLPPVGVLLHEGLTSNFWIDLLLTLLFWLPGMIYAFIVCFA